MKSVLIVTDAWHPQVNGPVRTMTAIGDAVAARGYKVDFLTPQQYRTFPMPGYREIEVPFAFQGRTSRLVDEIRPDFIHLTTEGTLGHAVRKYCMKRGYPFATSYHTQFPEYLRARAPVPIDVTYALLKRFHAPARWCLTPTESVDRELRRRGFANTVVWNRGVDTVMFDPKFRVEEGPDFPFPRPVFLYVGRIAVEKNIEQFLALDLPGTKLVVGDGPLRAAIEPRYPDVVFAGRVPDETLGRYFASADVFVFPSRTDTLGLVLLEALASGTPVAALPVRGPLDVVGDAPIARLNEDLRTAAMEALEISRADCRAYAERFSWAASADQFLEYLPEISR